MTEGQTFQANMNTQSSNMVKNEEVKNIVPQSNFLVKDRQLMKAFISSDDESQFSHRSLPDISILQRKLSMVSHNGRGNGRKRQRKHKKSHCNQQQVDQKSSLNFELQRAFKSLNENHSLNQQNPNQFGIQQVDNQDQIQAVSRKQRTYSEYVSPLVKFNDRRKSFELDQLKKRNKYQNNSVCKKNLEFIKSQQESPIKIQDEQHLFSKYKRFTLKPLFEEDKEEREVEQEKISEKNQDLENNLLDRRHFYKKEKQPRKFHTKYKFPTFKDQMKQVPPTPENSTQFLMQNFNSDTRNIRKSSQFLYFPAFMSPLPIVKEDNEENETFNSCYQQISSPNINAFKDVGGTMNFLVDADTFLDIQLEECKAEENPLKQDDIALTRKQQLQREIQQQKMVVDMLIGEIRKKDKILSELQQQQKSQKLNCSQ